MGLLLSNSERKKPSDLKASLEIFNDRNLELLLAEVSSSPEDWLAVPDAPNRKCGAFTSPYADEACPFQPAGAST
jgi:hypothetical protein